MISNSTGWTIVRATKSYGPHIVIDIEGDSMTVNINPDNPAGITMAKPTLPGLGTEQNADKLGFQLANLFTALESLRPATGPTNSADSAEEGASSENGDQERRRPATTGRKPLETASLQPLAQRQ